MQELILYSTLGCHLCELAKEQLEPLLAPLTLRIVEVDIADDDNLVEQYGVRIPVVKLGSGHKELGWPFDTQQAYDFIMAEK